MSASVREYRRDTMKQIEMQYSYSGLTIAIRGSGYSEFAAIQTAIGVLMAEAWNMSHGLACDAVPEEVQELIVELRAKPVVEVEEECDTESASGSEGGSSRA